MIHFYCVYFATTKNGRKKISLEQLSKNSQVSFSISRNREAKDALRPQRQRSCYIPDPGLFSADIFFFNLFPLTLV